MSVRAFAPAGADPLQAGSTLELDDEESRYLIKVRRVRIGEALEVFDAGSVWIGRLVAAGRRARVRIDGPRPPGAPVPTRVVLLGLPDAAATLEAVTGACELGATQLVFVRCERSSGHLPSAGRLERVMRAAMRQCGRPSPPELLGAPPAEPWSLANALAHHPQLPGVFGSVDDRDNLTSLIDSRATEPAEPPMPKVPRLASHRGPPKPSRPASGREVSSAPIDPSSAPIDPSSTPIEALRLLVGPEGGLTPAEIEAAAAAGFVPTRLGPWILRTPTAVVALLARFGSAPAGV
ncbi:RsmE family RNA methyltransferase [Enhygromyxa salina]|uniref:RsmE family RNA methyltransferase n=1 Tax=Enhygromyxa salina TaxID=215803 RepID=UPI0004E79893|nr:RsmE family RNA methyltransferase [Enhygromyxa salina]